MKAWSLRNLSDGITAFEQATAPPMSHFHFTLTSQITVIRLNNLVLCTE